MTEAAKNARLFRPDDRLYAAWANGCPVYLYWSEMTLAQRRTQIAFELDESARRIAYVENFNPCGIA